MSKHYRSDIDEYTGCPPYAVTIHALRPKSLRKVNSIKELNRLHGHIAKLEADLRFEKQLNEMGATRLLNETKAHFKTYESLKKLKAQIQE